jgi:phosphoribosylaminoimidazole carboxylase PurE protein
MDRARKRPVVGILMGSDSDFDVMTEAASVLDAFGIPYEMMVTSAHRSPERTSRYAKSASGRGIQVIIAGAGGAAHLAGVIASYTVLPVIGVPIPSSPLGGMDSLLSIVQMPSGVPVATMSIGKGGARNAGIMATQMLALKYPELRDLLEKYRDQMDRETEKKNKAIAKMRT